MVARFIVGLINFFLGLAEIFLGLRIFFRLLAANPNVSFVQWIYTSSNVLLQPFRGIFPTAVIARNRIVDFSAIFAMIVYGLVALLFVALIGYIMPNRTIIEKKG